jgi:hypothetical protein
MFSGLLDSLAGQFYKKKSARCVAKDFAGQLTKDAQEFFSVVIVCDDLEGKDVFGVLCDDSRNQGAKNTFTFVIYIDYTKIDGNVLKILFSLILAHEICHFAFYYELFLSLGQKNSGSRLYNEFKHTITGTFENVITPAKDVTSQTAIDAHDISELLYTFGKYPDEHFAKKNKTSLDYRAFFFHFLEYLKFGKLLESAKSKSKEPEKGYL